MIQYGFGADIGGTTVKLGLFKSNGEILDNWEIPTDNTDGGKNILPGIANTINSSIEQRGIDRSDIIGIGVGVPGPVQRGGVVNSVNLGWVNKNVAGELRRLTGLAVKIENDANVAALGELWMGSGMGYNSLIMVTLGTGIGGGFVINGKIIPGAHGAGGEIGHIQINPDETIPCKCGRCGCFEQYASATGCVRLAREYLESSDEPSSLRDIEPLTAKAVWDCADEGDYAAIEITEKYCEYLARGLAVISTVIDPEVIVLGGGVSRAGAPLLDLTTEYYRKFAFSPCKDTPIHIASLENDAGMYGCMFMLI